MFFRFTILLGVLAAVFLLPFSVHAKTFSDVPSQHKNYQAITALSNEGLIDGYPNGSFQPERPIRRNEAVKLLVSAQFDQNSIAQSLDWHMNEGHSYASFVDVPTDKWYAPYVEMAYQNGIIGGYPNGEFKPRDTLNFAEGLKVILETLQADTIRVRFQENPLLYVKRTDWFAQYFGYAYNKNLINREKFYYPPRDMTRGEFAEVLYRLKNIQASGADEFVSTVQPFSNEYTITIPRLGIFDVNVTFADPYSNANALAVLKDGLGHYLSPPGQGGKMVLFGHSSGYSWDNSNYKRILRQINKLEIGDLVYINYQEKGYVYQVNNKEIMPANKLIDVMDDDGYEELAMFTCWPPDSIIQRYVVYATPL